MRVQSKLYCCLLIASCLLLLTVIQGNAQTKKKTNPSCSIGKTSIECPKYFKKLADTDPNIRLLKYKDDQLEMYFFISLVNSGFDDTHLKEAVGKLYAGNVSIP